MNIGDSEMTNILAVEASEQNCSVALGSQNKDGSAQELWHRAEMAPRRHADLILPMVDAVLQESKINLANIDAITFTRGPGAFTGIRIATAAVQGLAYASDIPVVPVSTLELIAHQVNVELGHSRVAVALDARMDEVYFGAYEIKGPGACEAVIEDCVCRPELVTWSQLSRGKSDEELTWFGAGSGWCYHEVFQDHLQQSSAKGLLDNWQVSLAADARYLLPIASTRIAAGKTVPAAEAQPVYLRDSVAWQKQK